MSISNYVQFLLTKQLGVTTDSEKPEKRFVPCYFHPPILKEGEDNNKKKDIESHHGERLYGVMMTQMLQARQYVTSEYVQFIKELVQTQYTGS